MRMDLPTPHVVTSEKMTIQIFIISILDLRHLSRSYADSLGSQKISVICCSDQMEFMWDCMLLTHKYALFSLQA